MEIFKEGVFAKFENQLISQALGILILKNGGTLEIPLSDLQDAQSKRIHLSYEISNKEKKLTFKAHAETVEPVLPPSDSSSS